MWYHFPLPPLFLYIYKPRCYSFVLIDISLIPKSGITFPGHLAGGTTASGSLPSTFAHSCAHTLIAQIKLPAVCPSLHPRTSLLQNYTHLPLQPSFPQVLGSLGSSEGWTWKCMLYTWSFFSLNALQVPLDSLDQGIMLLLMLVPTPGMPLTNISICWNFKHTSLSLSHMPNSLEMFSVSPDVTFLQPSVQLLNHV